ncbi:MAG: UPF0164 family protein [Treponema sp.]|nr:UPF0164 family protein [Treponema sp.]
MSAADFDQDAYASVSDFLNEMYGGIDDNAGLTAFPVLNVPMGGKSEAMGTSFTAVADDLSFIAWNPAGSSMMLNTGLGFFHNNWIADTNVEGIVYTSRVKDLGFAAAGKWLYAPFTEYNLFGDRVSMGYYTEAVGTLNISYNLFSGYYFTGISLGLNVKGAFRSVPDFAENNDTVVEGSGMSQSAASIMADFGALTRFNLLKFYNSRERNTSLGIVIRNMGLPSMEDPLPTVISAGLAYKPFRPMQLAFDFSIPLNMADPSLSEKPYWSVGLSAAVANFLSLRAGLLSKTGNARVTVGTEVILQNISLDINWSMDLLTKAEPLNRISLAFRFNFGDQGRQAVSDEADNLYFQGLDAYAIGNYGEAQYYWEETLKIMPKFEPAKEGLQLIARSRDLEAQIRELMEFNN